ncbi:MAG: hypothetical protein LBM75_09115 [Myxococcales bacterium]|jgi:hypothetical protein|nr:hypothetical protein [Myxococcales bacterium]
MNLDLTSALDQLLTNGTFLVVGVLLLYVGMRWPRHALKLAVLLVPLTLCSSIWAVRDFQNAMSTIWSSEGLPALAPNCGKNAKCLEHFEKAKKAARAKQQRELLESLVAPLLLFAMTGILIRRGRFARRHILALKDKDALLAAPLDVSSIDAPPFEPPRDEAEDDTARSHERASPLTWLSDPDADAEEAATDSDPHERWWATKARADDAEDLPHPKSALDASDDDARWMPKPPPPQQER